jgi:hypothetical protein
VPANSIYNIAFKAKTLGGNADLGVFGGISPINQSIGNAEWAYFNFELTSGINKSDIQIDVPTDVVIDDIVFFPKGSQINLYTYEIGKGVSSKTDTNGVSNYFIYDDLGRLIKTLDQDKNILITTSYNYKNR